MWGNFGSECVSSRLLVAKANSTLREEAPQLTCAGQFWIRAYLNTANANAAKAKTTSLLTCAGQCWMTGESIFGCGVG